MENKHLLTLDSQKVLSITNALEVLSFSDREIRIKLKDNTEIVFNLYTYGKKAENEIIETLRKSIR